MDNEGNYFTKDGRRIIFETFEQSPYQADKLGRGWVVHLIKAYIEDEDECVGYIKMSYVPYSNFRKEYRNIVQFADKIGGKPFIVKSEYKPLVKDVGSLQQSDAYERLPIRARVKSIEKMAGYPYYFDRYKGIDEHTDEELEAVEQHLLEHIKDTFESEFQFFQHFHVDKPLVDYIRVFDDYARNGIAMALYEKASRWLAENKGLKLYASGLQQPEAKAAWDKMEEIKPERIGREKKDKREGKSKKNTRKYLSYLDDYKKKKSA